MKTNIAKYAAGCALVLGLGIATASCGGATAETLPQADEEVREPLTPDALLPSDSFLVIRVDIGRFRSAASWDIFESWLLTAEEQVAARFPSLGDGGLRRWARLIDVVWVGLAPSGDPLRPDAFSVTTGSFEAAALRAELDALSPLVVARAEAVGSYVTDPRVGEIIVVGDGLAVTGTRGRVGEVVERHESQEGTSPLAGEAMATIAHRVSFGRDAFDLAAVMTDDAKAALSAGADARMQALISASTALGARVGVQDGIDAVVIAATSDSRVADGVAQELSRQRDAARAQPIVTMFGLAPILDGVGILAEDGDLRLSLRTADADLRNILGRATGIIGVAIAAGLEDLQAPASQSQSQSQSTAPEAQ